MTVHPGSPYHVCAEPRQHTAFGTETKAFSKPISLSSSQTSPLALGCHESQVVLERSPTTACLQHRSSDTDETSLNSPRLFFLDERVLQPATTMQETIASGSANNHQRDLFHTDSEGDDDWQPGGCSMETNDDSSDGFDNSNTFLTQRASEDDGLPTNHLDSLDDNDEDYDDMDDSPMDSNYAMYRGPVGYCVNCTSPLYSDTCGSCNHNASLNDSLFRTAHDDVCNDKPSSSSSPSPTIIVWDERMLLHEEGCRQPHPERPDRLRAVISRLQVSGLTDRCTRVDCREATAEELAAVHTQELITQLEAASRQARSDPALEGRPLYFQSDTYANEHTYSSAKLSAGGCAEAAIRVAKGEARFGAAIVRPPGHHAESGTAMGFCFFNNAAIAARAAQAAGASRVMILDWDVHHGNGTQHIFEDDPTVLYISIHRFDRGNFYPGTGAADESGVGPGKGFTVNVPWNGPGVTNADYLAAFTQVILPVSYEFQPDLILVSAGFDAAEGDPIGGCSLTPECYGHMTALLKGVAPLVVMLEGGYNLSSTAASTEACLRVLLGEEPAALSGSMVPSPMAKSAIMNVLQQQSQYWSSLVCPISLSSQRSTGVCSSLPVQPVHSPKFDVKTDIEGSHPSALAAPLSPEEQVHVDWWLSRNSPIAVAMAASASCYKRSKLSRRGVMTNRKLQILRAIHNSAVKAVRRRLQQKVLSK